MSRINAEREARTRYILESARALFAERGLENCTMGDIATAAEYTRRTLYAYFTSRDELYLKIHVEDLRRRWERQLSALAGVEGGLRRVLTWAESYIAHGSENPQYLRMESYWDFHGVDPERISPEVFAEFDILNDELAEALRGMFRTGVEDGSLRADLDVDMAVSQFLYSLRAVMNRAYSGSYSFAQAEPDAYLHHYLATLAHGIGTTGGSA